VSYQNINISAPGKFHTFVRKAMGELLPPAVRHMQGEICSPGHGLSCLMAASSLAG